MTDRLATPCGYCGTRNEHTPECQTAHANLYPATRAARAYCPECGLRGDHTFTCPAADTRRAQGAETTASENRPAHRPHVTQTFATPYECGHDLPTPCRDADHCATRHLDPSSACTNDPGEHCNLCDGDDGDIHGDGHTCVHPESQCDACDAEDNGANYECPTCGAAPFSDPEAVAAHTAQWHAEPLDEQRRRLPDTAPLDDCGLNTLAAEAAAICDTLRFRLTPQGFNALNDR